MRTPTLFVFELLWVTEVLELPHPKIPKNAENAELGLDGLDTAASAVPKLPIRIVEKTATTMMLVIPFFICADVIALYKTRY